MNEDTSTPERPKDERQALLDRQAALADFGRYALATTDLDAILRQACVLVARGLGLPIAKVLEAQPDGNLLLRAALGLPPGLARPGVTRIPGGEGSAAGFALQTGAVVVSDIATETRFDASEIVRRAGVRVSANVLIRDGGAFGTLEVDSLEPWTVTQDDIDFLQTYAALLAGAVERQRAGARLEVLAREREMLLHELQHRVKNMLANVRALSAQTRARSASLDDFAAAFDGRINALARTQDLLMRSPEDAVPLREVLRIELEAHGAGERADLDGLDLSLPPRVAQILGLTFHELATNAVKYGALAVDSGRIAVGWRIGQDRRVAIRWRETGVAVADTAPARGFGSEVIEESVPYMLEGEAMLKFHPDGVECAIAFPLPEA